ncbi:MAG TPA: 2-isopropylmalate synthase [Myxococcota bacterium]|nr:2-isopropylmalate synthase [Myxococcota bacterium]
MSGTNGRVIIFDTTLRDGEQSPGATMNLAEKLEVARALRDLGVDVIEAGFPMASPGDFEEVRAIAEQVQGPIIAGLARCAKADIETAWKALEIAERQRLHVFLATSPIHREYKLRMGKDEVVRRAVEGVERARALCEDVEFSAEDAARTELEYLAEVVERVIEAGARTVNLPDTVGYAIPEQYGSMIRYLKAHVPNVDKAVLSVHCHNDLGLAVANTLAALEAGARQVECTINGLGERAGNCALEEVVMALRTREAHYGLRTGIETQRLVPTSRLVANVTGIRVQRNKAIVGRNAFAHEAGIHQHGMLQHHSTYEIMRPEDVGMPQTQLVLGKHSGRHALRQRVETLGYHLDEAQMQRLFEDFKRLADKKKEIYDADIEALIEGHMGAEVAAKWQIVAVNTSGGVGTMPSAAVALKDAEDVTHREAACGDGPVDAVFNAIVRITGVAVRLKDYRVNSVTVGTDSQGEAKVEVEFDGRVFKGRGTSTDIIEASARAFLNAVNRVVLEERRAGRSAARDGGDAAADRLTSEAQASA